ncbi:hypothetical protein AMAG_03380 [Allomyces macrogynus ATCC 38327]|uniref:Uncharacterized protein n=1 Tax=Allomyces macrogynus (strain ATCC 38327) TaxID=578462 RepID=A0A0L0S9B5_ALLM3|nr:hypothetical protein AMAG_03380 [Allomyces macrogynus ATCC 38327]|eukprot:KNE59031.1 hypothetical protein AMAG_03380 [Allomyces macrogynus ATCC 38327]
MLLSHVEKPTTRAPAAKVGGRRRKTSATRRSDRSASPPMIPDAKATTQAANAPLAPDPAAADAEIDPLALRRELDRAVHEAALEHTQESRETQDVHVGKAWTTAPAHLQHTAAPPRQNKGQLGKMYPLFQPRPGPMF